MYQCLFPPQMLVQLWPYINDMVVKILKEQVEPEIQKNVPGFLSSIHFEEISLGDVVSQTHSVHSQTQNSEGYSKCYFCQCVYTCRGMGNAQKQQEKAW